MDPLSALGLAGTVVAFVEFGEMGESAGKMGFLFTHFLLISALLNR
jgi:hypothetical protein